MDCPHVRVLSLTLQTDYEGPAVFRKLQAVFRHCPIRDKRKGVEMVLCQVHRYPNQMEILRLIADNMPQDEHKPQRLDILTRVPVVVNQYPEIQKIVANHLTNIVMEPNDVLYRMARNNFGEFLITIPTLICEKHSYVSQVLSDGDKLEFLAYMEQFIKPIFSQYYMRMSNSMYSVMAKKAPNEKFDLFFKCVMESNNYSYHNIMAALTHRVKDSHITVDRALDFMTEKKNQKTTSDIFGKVSPGLVESIEHSFVTTALKSYNRDQMDKFLNGIRRRGLIQSNVLKAVGFEQFQRFVDDLDENATFSEILDNMASRCILTRQVHISEKRHEILNTTLGLEQHYDDMTPRERKMFFAILATQSFPKGGCEVTGSDFLFRKLANRLFELIPPRGTVSAEVDLNEYASVLYCMYNLFNYRRRHKRILRDIAQDWRTKILATTDLHIMTSDNLVYEINEAVDESEKLRLRRLNHVVVVIGQLLVGLFGVFRHRNLYFMPHYWSLSSIFYDFVFTDSFNTELMVTLTSVQTAPGAPVRLLGGEDCERIEQINRDEDDEGDTDEEDDESESDDEDDEDDEDTQSSEEESDDDEDDGDDNEDTHDDDNTVDNGEDTYDENEEDDDADDEVSDDELSDDDSYEEDVMPIVQEEPEYHSHQWWRNFYGIPNGFTNEVMSRFPNDVPVYMDPRMWEEE